MPVLPQGLATSLVCPQLLRGPPARTQLVWPLPRQVPRSVSRDSHQALPRPQLCSVTKLLHLVGELGSPGSFLVNKEALELPSQFPQAYLWFLETLTSPWSWARLGSGE